MKLLLISLMGVVMASFVGPTNTKKSEIKISTILSKNFQKALKEVTFASINGDKGLESIKGLNKKVIDFLSKLYESGSSEIIGKDETCRPICVTAQGTIEEGLAQMLNSSELKDVKAIILTPLPPTPLRKNGDTKNLSNVPFDVARQYTLNMREFTLRALRDANAQIISAYSNDTYDSLTSKDDEGSIEQVRIWEEEKKHPNSVDMPLSNEISEDVIGALYLITDNKNNKFYLSVQSIQAKSVTEKENTWKMFLSSNQIDDEGTRRALKMLKFIESNSRQKIDF